MELNTLKNKYILAYPLFALSFVLGSCSQEGDNDLPEKSSQRKTITFTANPVTAETKGISTRVGLVPGNEDGDDELKWVNNEKVSIKFAGDNSEIKETFTVKVTGDIASITGLPPATEDVYQIRAISPDKDSHFPNGGYTTLTIPDVQTQDIFNKHLSEYIYMYAYPGGTISVDGAERATGDIELDFDLLTSLLRFEIINNSTSDVTLSNIKISFPSGQSAKLYKNVILNEEDGSLVTQGQQTHGSGMTLNLSDAFLGNTDSSIGYMSIFPTTSVSTLDIDLTIKTTDGRTKTISYTVTSAPIFESKSRYTIALDFNESDLEPSIEDMTGLEDIGGKKYVVYKYKTTTEEISWMVTPAKFTSHDFDYATNHDLCPDSWRAPTVADLQDLQSQFTKYPEAKTLFIDNSPTYNQFNDRWFSKVDGTFEYVVGNVLLFADNPNRFKHQHFNVNGLWVTEQTALIIKTTESYITQIVTDHTFVDPSTSALSDGVRFNQLIRCVKN
jgi:hypothetical protein